MANSDEEIKNAIPVAQLLGALNRANDAMDAIIERDVKIGLYKLKAGPRREQVKLLADQGLSNRQIAKVLEIDRDTVQRDLGGGIAATTGGIAATTGPNGSPPSKVQPEPKEKTFTEEEVQKFIQQAKIKLQKEMQEEFKDTLKPFKDKVEALEEEKRIRNREEQERKEKSNGPEIHLATRQPKRGLNLEFNKQINQLVQIVHDFKNNKSWRDRLKELETYKNDIQLNGELLDLERLVGALYTLEQEVLKWRKQITPTSEEWYNRQDSTQPDSKELT